MTLEEFGIVGALGALSRLAWIFGLFPMTSTPEVKVSKWKSVYGRYFMLPYLVAIFIWKSYIWYIEASHTILSLVEFVGASIMMPMAALSTWNAPERTQKWLECLRTTEKVIVRTKAVNKMEKKWTVITIGYLVGVLPLMATMSFWNACSATNSCTVWAFLRIWPSFPFLINVNCMMFLFNLFAARIHFAGNAINEVIDFFLKSDSEYKTENRQILFNNYISNTYSVSGSVNIGVSEKIRDLALTYISLCQVIDTILETVSIMLLFLMISGIMSLMTAAVIIVDVCLAPGTFQTQRLVIEIIWCVNVIVKTYFFSEPCQLIYETMFETRELINQLRRKYSTNENVVNELKLFKILISLYRPIITPWNMYTVDRSLVAQLSGCTITYFVAVMQLGGRQLARHT